MIPLIVGPFLWDLTTGEIALFSTLNFLIWVAFAVDFGIKLVVSPRPDRYIRAHWLDALIVAVPFFRPLRIVRLILYGSRAFRGTRRLTENDFILSYGFGAVVIATTLVTTFERNQNSELSDFPEALWWAVVTVTTVGYGDITPVTLGGRIVAGILMVIGIGLFSAITANVASRFVARDTTDEIKEEVADINLLVEEIRALRAEVRTLKAE